MRTLTFPYHTSPLHMQKCTKEARVHHYLAIHSLRWQDSAARTKQPTPSTLTWLALLPIKYTSHKDVRFMHISSRHDKTARLRRMCMQLRLQLQVGYLLLLL